MKLRRILLILALGVVGYLVYDYATPVASDVVNKELEETNKQIAIANTTIADAEDLIKDTKDRLQTLTEKQLASQKRLEAYNGTTSTQTDTVRTPTNTACIKGDTILFSGGYWEDYTKVDDCGEFAPYTKDAIKGCYVSTTNEYCLLNNDLKELNDLFK